jgi:hypothetical protein
MGITDMYILNSIGEASPLPLTSKGYRIFIQRCEEVTGDVAGPPKTISTFLSSFFLTGVEHSLKSSTRASTCRINQKDLNINKEDDPSLRFEAFCFNQLLTSHLVFHFLKMSISFILHISSGIIGHMNYPTDLIDMSTRI